MKSEYRPPKIAADLFRILCFAILFAGCAVWRPLPFKKAEPPPLSDAYLHYYDYPAPVLHSEVLKEEKKRGYILRTVEFPLTLPPELEVRNPEAFKKQNEELAKTDQKTAKDQKLRTTNRIDFYIPQKMKPGERRPVILISPILGGNMVVDHFARYYARRGLIAALVYRKRIFWEDQEGIDQVEKYMRTSVIRLRQAVDWLEEQPEVDKNRIGAFGISYGAILHSVLAAVEPRIKYHVLAMPGGPLPEVIVN